MPSFTCQAGTQVYYEQYGKSGPVLIMVHGLASSGRIWLRQTRVLKKNFQVYAIDLPGHGQSEPWSEYSFNSLADVLEEWMEHCNIHDASFISLSIGCTVTLTFAARYPERVNALVLEGPVNGYRPWFNPCGWPDWLMFKSLPLLLETSVAMFGTQATARWLNTYGVKAKRSFKTLESMQTRADFKAIRQLLWENICPPYIGKLQGIKAPTLIIRGCNDPMPKRFVRYIQTHLPQATLIEIPQSRHIVALEKPEVFNELVADFLNGHLLKHRTDPERTFSA